MNEKKDTNQFKKGVLCGILAMCVILGVGMVVKKQLRARDENLAVKTEEKLEQLKYLVDELYLYSDDVTEEELEDGILKGYVDALGDPYSVYYNEEETKELYESTEGEYSGIGAVFSQNINTKEVTAVQIYDGPAKEAGMQEGDILYKVDGEDVSTDDISETVKKIKGEENTKVELTMFRGDENAEVTLEITRRKIEVKTVVAEMKEDGIGYLQITQFDAVTLKQFNTAMEELEAQGMKGLVVDLRSNPGGSLDTVVKILDTLLPEGTIVYTENKNGKKEVYSSDAKECDLPMAVLVNEYSASASEIFAGAIQDYEKGPIVGTTTYGKGIVQQIVDLKDGTAMKVTISEYFTPNGRNIHGKGIEPDVEVEYEYDEADPEADNQLDAAMEEVHKLLKK